MMKHLYCQHSKIFEAIQNAEVEVGEHRLVDVKARTRNVQ